MNKTQIVQNLNIDTNQSLKQIQAEPNPIDNLSTVSSIILTFSDRRQVDTSDTQNKIGNDIPAERFRIWRGESVSTRL